MAFSVCIIKIVKRQVDAVRYLFSSDPHELASWVKKIYRLIVTVPESSLFFCDSRPLAHGDDWQELTIQLPLDEATRYGGKPVGFAKFVL